MNDTKWDELRLAMYGLERLSPRWRTLDVESGHLSKWDRDWYYHFRHGGYKSIQWVEIAIDSDEQRVAVLKELAQVHVPGEQIDSGFRVFGYANLGQAVDYIRE
jgi:hypothetical protein